MYKNEIKCQLLDFVLTGDKRVELKEQEKLNNNNDLKKLMKYLELMVICDFTSYNWSPWS